MSALSSAQRIRGRREAPPSEAGARPDDLRAGWAVGDASRASPEVLGDTREVSSSGSQRSASSTKAAAPTAVVAGVRDAPTELGGRWALPRGTDATNVLPRPGVLSARTEPPWSRT